MKKILIAVRELDCGGTEVAMINLLKNLNPKKFEVTLLLARKRGVYLNRIPSYVKIIETAFEKEKFRYHISDDEKLVKNIIQKNNIKIIRKFGRGLGDILKKINYNLDVYNEYLLTKTKELDKEYDLALDFYGYGYFQSAYIAKKVKARKKIMWIHDERLIPMKRTRCYFNEYDYFFGVSQACVRNFIREFPETKGRVGIFNNILDHEEIIRKSKEGIEKNLFNDKKFNMVTVGRLEWQKGYDMAIDIASKLSENNIEFCWYIIGEGSEEEKIRKKIRMLNLDDKVILLGRKDNPYPYIKKADVYIQTSRHEGYGLAIAEARILNKAIISTDLECVREQIQNTKNGYLVPYDIDKFIDIIIKLKEDRRLIQKVEENLKENDQSSVKEIEKLNQFI